MPLDRRSCRGRTREHRPCRNHATESGFCHLHDPVLRPRDFTRHPRHCGSYAPGHMVHWIQARKAVVDPDKRPGLVVGTYATTFEVRFHDGTSRRYHHHHPATMLDALDQYGPNIEVQERWNLVWFNHQLLGVRPVGQKESSSVESRASSLDQ